MTERKEMPLDPSVTFSFSNTGQRLGRLYADLSGVKLQSSTLLLSLDETVCHCLMLFIEDYQKGW